MKTKLMLIALGNDLRGDDGVAAAVCRALPSYIKDSIAYIELGLQSQSMPALVEAARNVIIVDAVLCNGCAGCADWLELNAGGVARALRLRATHALSWMDELMLAGMPLDGVRFFGIHINKADWQIGLSDEIKAAVPSLVAELAAACEKCVQDCVQHA